MTRTLILALALLAALPARGDPCAAIAEPLAYNACLASHGPAAHAVHMRAAPPPRSAPARPHLRRVGRGRRGRSEMVFRPGR